MALIFSRLARNFIKAGYFPTDEVTLQRIGQMLKLPPTGLVRMIDPCCGEGTAIADLRHMLAAQKEEGVTATTEALGIELDSERAWHAKKLLDRVLHTDIHDAVVKPRSMGLLFLNPPYGHGVSDKASQRELHADAEKAERLERTFLRKTVPTSPMAGFWCTSCRTTL
jgi:23S rRNA G2445 N2-methylase RlmL